MPVHIKEQLAWHAWNYRCPRCRGRGWCGCSKQNPQLFMSHSNMEIRQEQPSKPNS